MRRLLTLFLLILPILVLFPIGSSAEFPVPQTPFEIRQAIIPEAHETLTIDGRGDEEAWQQIPWSPPFVEIRGYDFEPAPYYETKIKMAWDDDYFYILAWLEEEHLWATYDQHDMVIYHENDFEVFIDPDGDNHNYLELEINALGTTWDLMLTAPYRDNGRAIDSWEMVGLKSAVYLDGTLNDPSDTDRGWGVELAIPWEVINEVDSREYRYPRTHPSEMHVNFSRVQWPLEVKDGQYQKPFDPVSSISSSEHNWVWSPQGLIAMHYPERWGMVRMAFEPSQINGNYWRTTTDPLREMAMLCYYAQKKYHEERDVYASKLKSLDLPKQIEYDHIEWPPEITWMRGGYQIIVYDVDARIGLRVREDGQLMRMPYHGTWFLDYMQGVRSSRSNDNQPSDNR